MTQIKTSKTTLITVYNMSTHINKWNLDQIKKTLVDGILRL